ncbi:MAG: CHAD domain-containing protein [Caldilineaceae bacterium]
MKFRVGDPGRIESLRAMNGRLAGKRLTPLQAKEILDLYWDTPDHALMRGGFGLRTRRADAGWQVTLKELDFDGDSFLVDRIEVEHLLPQADVEAFLAKPKLEQLLSTLRQDAELPDAWARVRLHRQNPRLQPLAMLRQDRDKRYLLAGKDDSTPPIAELSLDTVDVLPPAPDLLLGNRQGSPLARFHEVEVEAMGEVTDADFDKIFRSLNRMRSFQPSGSSKLTSALRIASAFNADGAAAVQPQTTMAEAGRAIWRQQLIEVLLNECPIRARTGDRVEAVHDMRVAIRRIRAAARIFGPYFQREEIRPYLRTLRSVAGDLGAARDLDVSLSLVRQYQKALGDANGTLDIARTTWKTERKRAYRKLTQRLGGKTYSRFVGKFSRFCNTPGMGVGAMTDLSAQERAALEVRHVLPGEIFAHYANMRVYESVLHHDTPPELFHALRIEGKRLRYALEFVEHLLDPKPAAALIEKLKAVQECLGDMNDAVVMQDRMRRFSMERRQPPPTPVISHLDDQIDTQRRRFGDLWADFVSPSTRRMLALAVAAL